MFCTEFLQNLKNHAQSAYHFAVRQRDDISQSICVVDSSLMHDKSTICVVDSSLMHDKRTICVVGSTLMHDKSTICVADSTLMHDKSTIYVVDSRMCIHNSVIRVQAKWVQNGQLLKTNRSVPIFNGQLFLFWLLFVQQHPFM